MFAEQQALQIEVAQELVRRLGGADWARAAAWWSQAGRTSTLRVRYWEEDGSVASPDASMSKLSDAFKRLKAAMADRDKGAWLSSELELSRAGRFTFRYNYDRRVYWDYTWDDPYEPPPADLVRPGDDTWLEEFERFPRRAEFMPEWARALGTAGPEVDEALLQRASAAGMSLPGGLAGLGGQPGWPELLGRVEESVRAQVQRAPYRELLSELGRPTGERVFEGLWQDVYAEIKAEVLDRAAAEETLRLWRGLAVVRALPPVELGALDPSAPLPAGSPAYEQLAEALIDVIIHDLEQRFPSRA